VIKNNLVSEGENNRYGDFNINIDSVKKDETISVVNVKKDVISDEHVVVGSSDGNEKYELNDQDQPEDHVSDVDSNNVMS
jgi:hypothetical protein